MAVIDLAKRYYCDQTDCYYTSWDSWIRWTVLSVVVVLFLILVFACSFRNARQRRSQGQSPYYGTGWAAPRYGEHQNHQPYYNNNNQYPPAPPQYSHDVPIGHSGYYGQQNGTELQPPPQVYSAGTSNQVYEPPSNPPPPKSPKDDGIIR